MAAFPRTVDAAVPVPTPPASGPPAVPGGWQLGAARLLASTADLPSLLSASLDLVSSLVGADAAGIYLYDRRRLRIRHRLTRGYRPTLARQAIPRSDDGPLERALVSGRTVRLDVDAASTLRARPAACSRMVVPIRAPSDDVVGVLDLVGDVPGALDDRAGGAVAALAALLSPGLLPSGAAADAARRGCGPADDGPDRLSSPMGLDAAVRADRMVEGAGDCCVVRQTSADEWRFVLAEVSHGGVAAANVAGTIDALVRSPAGQRMPLEGMVRRISRFVDACVRGRLVSLICGALHGPTRTLTYMAAGHRAPLLVDAGGRGRRLDVTAPPLGLFRGIALPTARVALGRGDTLAVCSAAVAEATDAHDEQFGEVRLVDALRGAAPADAALLCERVLSARRRFAGGRGHGGGSMLVVRA